MVSIKIIVGSVRPGRFNIQPATWIHEIAKKRKDSTVELLDLEKINLPFLDEAAPPSMHQYANEHTKQWARVIEESDGFVFVTPEYNHSYSPVLKNAIDYVYAEWNFKPVTYVSYGSLAGGSRAVEHLRGIAAETKMYDLREQVMLPNYWEHLGKDGKFQFTQQHEGMANLMLDSLIFWSQEMKKIRSLMKK